MIGAVSCCHRGRSARAVARGIPRGGAARDRTGDAAAANASAGAPPTATRVEPTGP